MKAIALALAKAQMEMGPALKDSVNPAFKSKYADLAAVMAACLPALNRNEIAVVQPVCQDEFGRSVKTILIHSSGETLECSVPLIVAKNDMQGLGSAMTYARRYGLMSMAGIAPDDDDGNAAAKAAPAPERINADQFFALSGEIERTGSDQVKLAQWLDVRNLEDLNSDQFARAMVQLRKKPNAATVKTSSASADLQDAIPY